MAYLIPAPDERRRWFAGDICPNCVHEHCVKQRAIAETDCFRCGEPIGYGVWLYHRREDRAPAHTDCPSLTRRPSQLVAEGR